MTSLTTKQRVKLNAALAIVHHQGHDVAALQRNAANLERSGRSRMAAYEAAFASLLKTQPALEAPIKHITSLIQSSDSMTVGRYDAALKAYNETGDEGHLNALEPMVRRDTVDLAVRDGRLSKEDADAGRIDWNALGVETAAGQNDKFEWKPAATPAPASPGQDGSCGAAVSPTGIRSAKAVERWARDDPRNGASQDRPASQIAQRRERMEAVKVTTGRASPYAGMAPAQIKEAFRTDHATQGWQRDASEG